MMQPPLQLSVPRAVRGSEINLPSLLPLNPRNASPICRLLLHARATTNWMEICNLYNFLDQLNGWAIVLPHSVPSLFLRPSENVSTSKGLGVSPSVWCCLVSRMNPSIDIANLLLSWPPIEPHGGLQDMWRMQRAVCVDVAVQRGTVSVGSSRPYVRPIGGHVSQAAPEFTPQIFQVSFLRKLPVFFMLQAGRHFPRRR